jgi:uncharacterized protein
MIGRKYEYGFIKDRIDSSQAELGIIYGRRRVGKSTILKSLQKEATQSIYFEGIKGLSKKAQITHFCRQLAVQTKTMQVVANSWQEAFDALTQVFKKKKIYVVFDEFPWMASERQELVGILKYYWDNQWKKSPRLTLVICGSIAQFMVKHLVHSEALHNRKTFELKIDPLPCDEGALFLKNKRSKYEILKFLMIFGGVPKYLEQLNPNFGLSKNMDRLCFKKGGFFLHEFETIFKEQFKVTRNYESIVKALDLGKLTKEEIARKLKTTTGGGLTTTLENLEQAEFIRKELSLSLDSRTTKEKTVRYVLSDEWLRFYFTYVQPSLKTIELNTKDGLFDRLTGPSLANFFGLSFENFCHKNIGVILKALDIGPEEVVTYGPYFKQPSRSKKEAKGVQIDLIIQKKGNTYVLIECKFKDDPLNSSIIREVEKKVEILSLPTKITLEKVLITANGVLPMVHKADYFHRIITLNEILP